jgi:hypothetical protein
MICEYRIFIHVKVSCGGVIMRVSHNVSGETEENHKGSQDNKLPGRDTNWASLKYKSRPLLINQSVRQDQLRLT